MSVPACRLGACSEGSEPGVVTTSEPLPRRLFRFTWTLRSARLARRPALAKYNLAELLTLPYHLKQASGAGSSRTNHANRARSATVETPSRRMRRPEEAAKMTTKKCDEALFQSAARSSCLTTTRATLDPMSGKRLTRLSIHMLFTSWHPPTRIVHGLGLAWDRSDDD